MGGVKKVIAVGSSPRHHHTPPLMHNASLRQESFLHSSTQNRANCRRPSPHSENAPTVLKNAVLLSFIFRQKTEGENIVMIRRSQALLFLLYWNMAKQIPNKKEHERVVWGHVSSCFDLPGSLYGSPRLKTRQTRVNIRVRRNWSAIDAVCQACLCLARWDATSLANVVPPPGHNSRLLSYPGWRRPPGRKPQGRRRSQ